MKLRSLLAQLFMVLALSSPAMASIDTDIVIPIPEYEKDLSRVLLSLPMSADELGFHGEILSRFPEYTEFVVLVSEDKLDALSRKLEGSEYGKRVTLVPFGVDVVHEARFFARVGQNMKSLGVYRGASWPQGTFWARDSFVSCKGEDGKTWLMVPSYNQYVMQPALGDGEQGSIQFDNDYLLALRDQGVRMQKNVPLVFDGGNVLFDKVDGESLMFIGIDDVRTSLGLAEAVGAKQNERALLEAFRKFFNVDRVVVLGHGDRQPHLMFHLDQAMVLLPGQLAAIVRPVGTPPEDPERLEKLEEVGIFLHTLRTQLKRMGYKVFDLDVSMEAVLEQRFPNPVVFTDKESGHLSMLLTTYYENEESDGVHRNVNLKRLRERGIVAGFVKTDTNSQRGGIHCLINNL